MFPPPDQPTKGNSAVRVDLMECVKKTQAVAQAMADRKWDLAVELRGKSFQNNLNTYRYVRPQTRPQYFSSTLGRRCHCNWDVTREGVWSQKQ